MCMPRPVNPRYQTLEESNEAALSEKNVNRLQHIKTQLYVKFFALARVLTLRRTDRNLSNIIIQKNRGKNKQKPVHIYANIIPFFRPNVRRTEENSWARLFAEEMERGGIAGQSGQKRGN